MGFQQLGKGTLPHAVVVSAPGVAPLLVAGPPGALHFNQDAQPGIDGEPPA
jgi:hypothetical protein